MATDSSTAHVSLRLLSIYFGLCLVAAASMIYTIFCPKEIKQYGSSADYIGGAGQNHSVVQLVEISGRTNQSDSRFGSFRTFVKSLADEVSRGQVVKAKDHREKLGETEANGLHNFYEMLNCTRYSARASCAMLYAIGLLILAIPATEAFLRVGGVLIRTISKVLTS